MNALLYILGAQLAAAAINRFLIPKHSTVLLPQIISTIAIVSSFCTSLFLFCSTLEHPTQTISLFNWIRAGSFQVDMELLLDRLSAIMLLIITGIGSLIHVYAGGYLSGEKESRRFFSYMSLFVFMMLLLVLANNLVVLFIGWEGVGLCSYLLIGYWYEKTANAKAGMKAFVINRIGDFGVLLAIFLLFHIFGTVSFTELRASSFGMSVSQLSNLNWICLCLFIGVCGKSAQLPLFVWLPDAMAGPTPVSALIHAATMVTSGIYLMTRLDFFFLECPKVMTMVAIVGAATALTGAVSAIGQRDVKKVLAFSTVSQLGYMVMACGVGAFGAAMLHLLTHACFKALLFLGAGSIISAYHHRQDLFEMGGLRKTMPITYATMVVGVLAIIGAPGFSGFFSKDAILWSAFLFPQIGPALWLIGFITAGITAFYMVRWLALAFHGDNRLQSPHVPPEETSPVMWIPLIGLAVLSVTTGLLGVPSILGELIGLPNIFDSFLSVQLTKSHRPFWSPTPSFGHTAEIVCMSTTTALVAVCAWWSLRRHGNLGRDQKVVGYGMLDPGTRLNSWYYQVIVGGFKDICAFLDQVMERRLVSGLVSWLSQSFVIVGGLTSFRMSGSLRRYLLAAAVGVTLALIIAVG